VDQPLTASGRNDNLRVIKALAPGDPALTCGKSGCCARTARVLAVGRAVAALLALCLVSPAFGQANSYTNTGSGKWEASASWSAGAPGLGDSIYLTNAPTKAVTVDQTTESSFPGTMDVSNLWISAPSGSTNTLLVLGINNLSVPFVIDNALTIAAGGSVLVSNSDWGALHSMTVSNGSLVVLGDTIIPGYHNFQFTVTGPTGFSSNNGAVYFVEGSSNNLLIADGARLDTGDVYLGFSGYPESFDSVTVTGTNSQLNVGLWSIGEAGSSNHVYIADGGTVRIAGILTLSSDPASQGNTVTLLPGGTLIVGSSVFLANTNDAQAGFQVSGGSTILSSDLIAGSFSSSTGTVGVTAGGLLIATNGVLGIGNDGTLTHGSGSGTLTVSNGTVVATTVNLGSSAGGKGLLTLQTNSLITISSNLNVVSGSLGSTSSVSVTGGSLFITNGAALIGSSGSAQMTISGGSHIIKQIRLGSTNGSGSGSFYGLGGHLQVLSSLSANFVLVDGIDIDGSGGTIIIGDSHDAEYDLESGMCTNWGDMTVGYSDGYTGTYVQDGGTMLVTNELMVGNDCADGSGGALGEVMLNGGWLYVTNATHTAVLDVRNGTLVLEPGATLVVDTLVVTNACAQFMNLGGTLVLNNPYILSPQLDADGDGQSNWAEALAGTDPLNPASVFKTLGAVRTNRSDVRLDWTTVAGHSYVVQTNASLANGAFHDATQPIAVGGAGEGTTNYVQPGGATNKATYYRVRLGP